MPGLIQDVQDEIHDTNRQLQRLGHARETPQEQRTYLLTVSQDFKDLIKAAADGRYEYEFFRRSGDIDASVTDEESHAGTADDSSRLRAVVQNGLTELADNLSERGQTYKIVDFYDNFTTKVVESDPRTISRSDYVEKVEKVIKRARGRELQVTFNPQIIGELFYEQSGKWSKMVQYCVADLLEAAKGALAKVLEHVADKRTADRLEAIVINPAMARVADDLRISAQQVLQPYTKGHPITYNSALAENIHKASKDQMKRRIHARLCKAWEIESNVKNVNPNRNINIHALLSMLCDEPERDMKRHACSEAIDIAQAYYEVSDHSPRSEMAL